MPHFQQLTGDQADFRIVQIWHWVNGNIRREGLDSDIDAFKRSGIGGVYITDANAGLPKGDVEYNSDEWLDLVVHSVEKVGAKGMKAVMHNGPGYAGIGSDRLPTNMSMKQLVWTETRISSNNDVARNGTKLPAPFQKMGIYEDVFALAYPVQAGESTVFRDAVKSIVVSGKSATIKLAETLVRDTPVRLESASDFIDIEMNAPFLAQGISIYRLPETPENTFDGPRDYPPSWELSASNDSSTWVSITSFEGVSLRSMDAPAVGAFSSVTAKYFRLQASGPSWIIGIDISGGPRLPNWAIKSHGAYGTLPASPATFPENISSVVEPSSVIDVSKHLGPNGTLNWAPHSGTYTVVRIGYTVTGQDIPATPDGHEGLGVDLFSSEAIDVHFDTHLDRVISALEPFIPETFTGFVVDSYELGMQNWGGDLADDFHSYSGYSIVPWILCATGRLLESAAATEKFLFDFRSTHAHLTAAKSYGYFRKRLAERGLELLVEPYGDGPFDNMEVAAYSDYGFGEFWSHYVYGSDAYPLIATSSTDQHETYLIPEEAFTGHPLSSALTEHPYQLKVEGDRELAFGGTNRFYLHSYSHQPVDAAFPGMMLGPFGAHFDRMSTWTDEASGWTGHYARAALLMQQGNRVSDIGCFKGEERTGTGIVTYDSPYNVPLSYQTAIIGPTTLFDLHALNRRAQFPSGASYGLLIFPKMERVSEATVQKLHELAGAGVPLLLQSTAPTVATGLNDSDAVVSDLAEKLWQQAGNGVVFVDQSTTDVLKAIDLQPDFEFTSSSNDAAIYYNHHEINGEDFYFISNSLRKPADVVISLRSTRGSPEIWNPTTGEITPPPSWDVSDGRTHIGYKFKPAESIFVRLAGSRPPFQLTSIGKDGVALYNSRPFEGPNEALYANISSTFTMSLWAKPETYSVSQYYIFYPPVSSAYGSGHSAVGLAMGTNGLDVVEAGNSSTPEIVASLDRPFSGWTHIALVYSNNSGDLYVDGKLEFANISSQYTVHPGHGAPDSTTMMTTRFVGDVSGVQVSKSALTVSEVGSIYSAGLPAPHSPPSLEVLQSGRLLVRENGGYSITSPTGSTSFEVGDISTIPINDTWTVSFPANRMPRERNNLNIALPKLQSLHLHEDFDIAHFSGTATYRTTFELPGNKLQSPDSSSRILLNLGRVENIAEVFVNGNPIGLSWSPPYEVDITSAVGHGTNELSVAVTNLWPNRLIGDESLPAENAYNSTTENFAVEAWPEWFINDEPIKDGQRVTFSSWRHYNGSEPLLESGLLGPVEITLGKVVDIKDL